MRARGDREWRPFAIGAIFELRRGGYGKRPDEEPRGRIPFLGATAYNNGVTRFVRDVAPRRDAFGLQGGVIAVNNNGSVGEAFYWETPFASSSDVTTLRMRNRPLGRDLGLFLATCIRDQGRFFHYARKWSLARMAQSRIMLPVDQEGNPDYPYMERFVSEKRHRMLACYRAYAIAQLSRLEYRDITSLADKEWRKFQIGALFKVSRPKPRTTDAYQPGDIPFVASGAVNNGVVKCCKPLPDEKLDPGNCITVSPVDGSSFYQPIAFLGRGGAGSSILILRSQLLNRRIGPFMARVIQQACSKYTYGHQGTSASVAKESILLPVDADGQPNYAYMEHYAQNALRRKYEAYLAYLDRMEGNHAGEG